MKHALRVTLAAALVAAAGAAPAAAAPPASYDQEAVSAFDAARSVTTVRYLAETIGPRRSATPDERLAAEYLGSLLTANGFDVQLQSVPFTGTRNVARITSSTATLPGGPNWQMSVSGSGRLTGPDAAVTAEVVYAGQGATLDAFPAGTAGKIVLLDQGANTAARNTQVANAVAAGAAAVIVGATGNNASPPTVTVTPAQPTIPIVGGGRAHLDWIKGLLAAGPLTLRLATLNNVNYPRTNVIGVRRAVGDPTGTKAPIVMVGAHIDTVLGAPGADDDGSGNGVEQEIARVLAQYPLDKELRIGGWAGEEDGYIGSQAYLASLPAAEKARFVGEWQMDMVGSPYPDAKLWALTPDGKSNLVTDSLHSSAGRSGIVGFNNCKLSRSDHQAFFDVGIPSAAISWINYLTPATGCLGSQQGNIAAEPEYHKPTDTMANIDQGRMQTMLSLVGGAVMHAALNKVTVSVSGAAGAPVSGAAVTGDCGDGVRTLGTTDATGAADVYVPHATCTFAAGGATAKAVAVSGDTPLSLTSATGGAGGSVPATLALTLGPAATFGTFVPGVANDYTATATANVISSAGDAALTVSDPGHLMNGTFSLAEPLRVSFSKSAWTAPVSNDVVTILAKQLVKATDPLRTGAYSKTLTFTLSTTNP